MSVVREFTCFKLLSHELQDMIWSHSFWPQMITLHYAECPSTSHISTRSDISHPSAKITPSSDRASPPAELEPVDTQAPAAFSVCRSSRAIAQSKGYKTWKLTRSDGKVRDLLWDPLNDTIFLATIQRPYFDLFVKHFLAQAGEIQSLALPYSFWDACYRTRTGVCDNGYEWKNRHGSRGMTQLMKAPSSLKEVFVIANKEFYESEVKGKTEDQLEFWIAPWGTGKGFYDGLPMSRKTFGLGVCPRISIAWNFEMISHGEDVELPECLVLDSFVAQEQEWNSWMNR